MNDCIQLSDRMAPVAHGRATWTASEAAHLAECADCAAEWRVLRAGGEIGAAVAASIPVDFMATRVVAALQAPERPRSWWAWLRWLALPVAAAAAIAVMVVPGSGPDAPGPLSATAELGILPELESLEVSDLELVLQLLPDPDTPVEIESFDELTDDEITGLLNSLEG